MDTKKDRIKNTFILEPDNNLVYKRNIENTFLGMLWGNICEDGLVRGLWEGETYTKARLITLGKLTKRVPGKPRKRGQG